MKKLKFIYLSLILLLSSSVLFGQNMTQEEAAFMKSKLMQKEAALGAITYDNGDKGVDDTPGDFCTDPILYGNINDAAQSGSIVSNGHKWYSFTGPDAMTVEVSLCGSSYDTKLEVWNDCADGTYTYINDDACGSASKIGAIAFVGGSTMYVKVYGYGTSSGNYTLEITGVLPPPDPDPITVFPYAEDFESGVFSAMTVAYPNTQSDITVEAIAANGSSFGAMFQGGPMTWGSTPADVDAAFAYAEHVSKLKMIIEPTVGVTDPFLLEFDLKQKHTFTNTNYEWFRVLVDGVPIADVNGNLYHQPITGMADNFARITYDLSAYQGLASFELTLDNAAKYNPGYSPAYDGDIAQLDNLSISYAPPPVPLSNWSFILIGLFSLIFVFIKFKK